MELFRSTLFPTVFLLSAFVVVSSLFSKMAVALRGNGVDRIAAKFTVKIKISKTKVKQIQYTWLFGDLTTFHKEKYI